MAEGQPDAAGTTPPISVVSQQNGAKEGVRIGQSHPRAPRIVSIEENAPQKEMSCCYWPFLGDSEKQPHRHSRWRRFSSLSGAFQNTFNFFSKWR
eukprot:1038595-Rhodomonas_salina.1